MSLSSHLPHPAAGTGLGAEAVNGNLAPVSKVNIGTHFRSTGKRVKLSTPQGAKRGASRAAQRAAKRVKVSGLDGEELLVEEELMVDTEIIVGDSVVSEIIGGIATGFRTFMGILGGAEVIGAAVIAGGLQEDFSGFVTKSDPLGLGDMFKSRIAKIRAHDNHAYTHDNSTRTLFKSFAQTNMTNSNALGLARTKKMKHVYSSAEGTIIRGADANADSFYVHANSLENPHQDGGDVHNALLYDQMVDLYERYYVTEATIRVDFFHEGVTGAEGAVVGISILDDTTTLTKPGHYQEVGNVVWKPINPGEHTTIVFGVKPGEYFGTSAISSDSRLAVTAGSDGRPSDPLYFTMFAAPIAGNAATLAYNVTTLVTIEYTAVWFDPKSVAQGTA